MRRRAHARLAHLGSAGICRIDQHGNHRRLGHELAQQLQPLRTSTPGRRSTPVTLPPGRFRLATRPSPTGSSPTAKTIGIVASRPWPPRRGAAADDHRHRPADQIGRQSRQAVHRPSAQRDRSRRSVPRQSQLPSGPPQCAPRHFWRHDVLRRNADHRHRLLRARSERPAPPRRQAMMNSRRFIRSPRRRARAVGWAMSPSALAVLRLNTRSYLAACSTGISAGLLALENLSDLNQQSAG